MCFRMEGDRGFEMGSRHVYFCALIVFRVAPAQGYFEIIIEGKAERAIVEVEGGGWHVRSRPRSERDIAVPVRPANVRDLRNP